MSFASLSIDFENPKHRSDFEKEVQSLTGLRHPNIVTLLATYIDEENCKLFILYLLFLLQAFGQAVICSIM